MYPTFVAAAGVHAVLLAADGVRGAENALDGPDGLLAAYLDINAIPPDGLRGDRWRYLDTSIRPWPCCRLSHPYVSAAIVLHDRLVPPGCRIGPEHISRIRVEVNASAASPCRPADARRRPQTLADAEYSAPFMTAHALAHSNVDLVSVSAACLHSATVLDLAASSTSLRTGRTVQGIHPHWSRSPPPQVRRSPSPSTVRSSMRPPYNAGAKVAACMTDAGLSDPLPAAGRLVATVALLPGTGHVRTDCLIPGWRD